MLDSSNHSTVAAAQDSEKKKRSQLQAASIHETAFGCPRDFMDNRFVYTVVSARARGLSIGVNINPDKKCNFDCLYCEVDRSVKSHELKLDTDVMAAELHHML